MMEGSPSVACVARRWGGVCFALVALACEPPPTVVIGVAARSNFVDAARLAVEDAVAKGGLPIVDTVMIEESGNQPRIALASAESLVATPGIVGVVGHSASAASVAASQVYNAAQVVQIAPTSTAEIYSETGPYSFRLVPADDRQGHFLSELVAGVAPEGGRIALLYVNDEYGRGLRSAFREGIARKPGLSVVLDLPHFEDDFTNRDVETTIGALGAAAPDLLVWLAREPVLDVLLPAIRARFGPSFPIVASDGTSSASRYAEEDGRWNGIQYIDFLDVDGTEARRELRARYRARFGSDATGPELLTYDAVCLLIEAIRQGVRSGAEMREYLASLGRERPPFRGITGDVTFDRDGNVARSYVVEVVEGPGSG